VVVPGIWSAAFTVPPGGEAIVGVPYGVIGGPATVSVASGPPVIASQRVQYYDTFTEVPAAVPAQALAIGWFTWYDRASPGVNGDNLHIVNPSATIAANGCAYVSGVAVTGFTAAPGTAPYVALPPGVIGGPVLISVDSGPAVLAAQRVQYNQSFNEVAARATGDTALYLPWYDHASPGMLNDNLHLTNPSAAVVSGSITVGGASGGTMPFSLQPFAGAYVGLPPGHIGGPVTVSASAPVLASQRVQYYGSFNEVVGRPASAAGSVLYMPWYDMASPGMVADNFHLLNPSATPATGTISVAGRSPAFSVPANGEWYGSLPGTIGGPGRIVVSSGPGILGSQRVQYYQSFNEAEARV